jgi:membrane metallo-endopeptidase-like protein 1
MDMEIQQVPWWNRRSRLERRFFVTSIGLLCACVGLAIGLTGVLYKNMASDDGGGNGPAEGRKISSREIVNFQTTAAFTAEQPNNLHRPTDGRHNEAGKPSDVSSYCMTPGCVKTASEILANMDGAENPCKDFYQFACGGFMEKTSIPDDRTRMSSFSVLGDELLTQVRMLLEEENTEDEPKPFQMARSVYMSCMDKERIEQLGTEPLKNILLELGGWPVMLGAGWSEAGYIWYEQVYRFRSMGYSVDYFFDFSVTTDLKNSSRRILDLDQPGLGMSREYLIKGLEDVDVQAYLEYMVDVATYLGAEPSTARSEMTDVLKFEMALANFSLPREERRNASMLYNPMRVSDLVKYDPNTPWLEYINNILSPDIIQVTADEVIIVDVPSYLQKFSAHLATVPARVQSNYMVWRVAAASMKYLDEEARKISLKFSEKLTGKSEETPRWRTCVGAAKGSLANAVGSMYVRKHFKEDAKQSALEMVSDIRAEFDAMLSQIDWMDDSTRSKAKAKAAGIVEHIGYPPELLDTIKLNDLYAGLELNSTHYLSNALNMTVFGTNYAFSKLREKVNKTDWVRHGRPAVVNAFYSPLENSIQFPAGILQGIFFSNDRPKYMNYGAIGWVIGHEITHGFDDQGRQFDMEGNLVDWWEPSTKASYLHKAKCIIEQYGNYTIPHLELSLNGINTQGENIADNGGIKEAYRAYNKWVQRNHDEKLLPGLGGYSQRQMFWISAANVWCAKYRDKALKLRVLTGVHSPDMFRVRGPFANMPEFSRDFNCPAGSPMNPQNKCEVW